MQTEQNLKLEEISGFVTTIASLQSGNAPGSDGFPDNFYKRSEDKLTLLLPMYKESFEKNILPPTLRHSSIILLKKNKDPSNYSSYRFI